MFLCWKVKESDLNFQRLRLWLDSPPPSLSFDRQQCQTEDQPFEAPVKVRTAAQRPISDLLAKNVPANDKSYAFMYSAEALDLKQDSGSEIGSSCKQQIYSCFHTNRLMKQVSPLPVALLYFHALTAYHVHA